MLLMNNSESPARKKIQNSCSFSLPACRKSTICLEIPLPEKDPFVSTFAETFVNCTCRCQNEQGCAAANGEKKKLICNPYWNPCFPWTAYNPLYLLYLHAPSCSVPLPVSSSKRSLSIGCFCCWVSNLPEFSAASRSAKHKQTGGGGGGGAGRIMVNMYNGRYQIYLFKNPFVLSVNNNYIPSSTSP